VRVAFIRNLHEEQNLSMKLTADRLRSALTARTEILDVRPAWPSWLNTSRTVGNAAGYVSRYALYPRCAAKIRADVYHIVDHAYAHMARVLPPERTICHCHDLMLLRLKRGGFGDHRVPKIATKFFEYSVSKLRDVAAVIAVSEATKRDVVEMLGVDPERVDVVYPPLDPNYRPLPASVDRDVLRRGLGLGVRPALLHVGGNWFYKNVEGLLHAFAVVLEHTDVKPVLVKLGATLSREQRNLARSLEVLPHIVETGPVSDQQLQRYYLACDALIFPSLWEGFGWPVVEAMASGLPVVCGSAGALAEAAGGAAELVDANSADDIARGILHVLKNPSYRHELVLRGFVNARRFDAQKCADRIFEVYCRVLDGNRREAICAD
jgi:glycosyltransferase involved in cell wall biosynthesis